MDSKLISDEDALATRLGQIADQFTEAIARGERPDVEGYAQRHPELAVLLRQVLPTIEALRSSTPAPASSLRAVLGDFRIIREIGRGGMGIVCEAEQISFPRKVALKLLPPHPGIDAKYLARFEREARTAAGLHHTSIVPVYAVGCDQGVHYYAMQFIDGQGLDQVIARCRAGSVSDRSAPSTSVAHAPGSPENASDQSAPSTPVAHAPGSPKTVARIGLQVAEALEYAHQRGVVHRDIKPSNLLLDGAGIVWITDFGLVKNLDESDNLTRTGDIVGTARYMSPEQTSMKRGPVDGRTDVYSLGVTLYELLTLRPAFDGGDHATVLQQVAQQEPIAPRQRNHGVPRDLETIVLKAMAKNPADRYRTAGELAAELRRFLAGEPILARPIGSLERLRRWCKRNPMVAGLTAAVAVTLLAGIGVSCFFAIQADDRAREALRERDRADRKAEEATASAELVRQEKRIADRHLYVARMNLVQQAWERGHAARVHQLLQALTPTAGADDLRGFDWHYFWRQSHRDLRRWQAHEHAISCLAWSPAGRLLATGGHDGSVRVWDPDNGQLILNLTGHTSRVRAIAFAPEGLTLVSASQDRSVRLWDLASGEETQRLDIGEAALALAIAADGRLAVGTLAGSIRLFDGSGKILGQLNQPGPVRAVAFSPDGTLLAGGGDDRVVRVWDAKALAAPTLLEGHEGTIRTLAFSPDSMTLASGGYDMHIRLWDMTTSMPLGTLRGHNDTVSGLAFSPDGGTLASGEGDPSHLFLPKESLRSRPGGVRARPGEVKLWDVATGLERASLRRHAGPVYCLAYHPDGELLASAGDDMAVVLWNVAGQERTQLVGHMREVNAVAVSPNGWLLASGSDDRAVRLWDMTTGRLRHLFANIGNIKAVAFSPDGTRLAAGGGEKTIRVWDTRSDEPIMTLKGHTRTVRSIAYSPDGRWLVSGAGDPYQKPARPGEVYVWDAASGELLADLAGHADVVRGVAISPDGRWIASGGDDRTLQLWDASTRQLAATVAMTDGVRSVAFSPDSRTLAIAGGDSLQEKPADVVLWDVAKREPRAVLEGHRATVLVVRFAPDGQTLATGSSDGTVRLWDSVTGQERALLEGHQGLVRALAFAPHGGVLATGDNEAMIRLWWAKSETPATPKH